MIDAPHEAAHVAGHVEVQDADLQIAMGGSLAGIRGALDHFAVPGELVLEGLPAVIRSFVGRLGFERGRG